MRHLLDGSVCWPAEICILGTGPNGVEHYDRLKERPVIAVNKSILILRDLDIRPAWWIMATNYYIRAETWAVDQGIEYCREVYTPYAFNIHTARESDPPYWFAHKRHSAPVPGPYDPLEAGGGIAGIGIQLARLLGTKAIALLGVDMWGATQTDGKLEEEYPCGNHSHKPWAELEHIQALIGADVVIWSQSAIERSNLQKLNQAAIDILRHP